MKRYRNLNQTLQKFLLGFRRCAPRVFEGFVGVEELPAVEQTDSVMQIRWIHTKFSHNVE